MQSWEEYAEFNLRLVKFEVLVTKPTVKFDGWINRWIGRKTGEWTDRHTDRYIHKCMCTKIKKR